MSKKDHKCSICGMPAKSKLHVEPEVGHIYICNDTDCRGAAVRELAEAESKSFEEMNQGRRRDQVEYTEKAGAVTLIIMIAFVVGYLVHKLLKQL